MTTPPPFRLGLLLSPRYFIPQLRSIRSAGELARRILDLLRYLEFLEVNSRGGFRGRGHRAAVRFASALGGTLSWARVASVKALSFLIRPVHVLSDRRYDAALAAAWAGFGPSREPQPVINPPSPVDRNPHAKLHLSWNIHISCNYDCAYCWFHGHWKDFARNNLYAPAADWIPYWKRFNGRHGPAKVDIAGGEPFTYPAFQEILAALAQDNIVTVSTNLSWAPERVIGTVDPAKTEFSVSFHPDFVPVDVFIEKIIKLRRSGFHTNASLVAYPPFLTRLPDWLDAFVSRGIYLTIQPFRGEWKDRVYPSSYTRSASGLVDRLIRGEYPARYAPETVRALTVNSASSGIPDIPLTLKYHLQRCSPLGKPCNTGVLYGRLQNNGDVTRCAQGGYVGNFFKDDFKMGTEPLPCPFHHCDCSNEMIYMRGAPLGPAAGLH